MYKTILVAIDGSETSNNALFQAIELSKDQKAKLIIIHVIEEAFIFHGGPGYDFSAAIDAYKKEGQRVLDNAKSMVKTQNKTDYEIKLVEHNPFQGRIADVIVEEAKQYQADLLILGTHGRRGFSHVLLGSVAEQTIRLSHKPTLLVPMPNVQR